MRFKPMMNSLCTNMPYWLRLGMCGRLLLGLLCSGLLSQASLAQQNRPAPTDEPDVSMLRQGAELPAALYESRLLVRALGLTPEQMRRMQDVRRQTGPEMNLARREVFQRRRALNEAIYGEEASEQEVEQRARALADAEATLIQLRARMQYRIRTLLTPEQLRILNELRTAPPGALQRRPPGP